VPDRSNKKQAVFYLLLMVFGDRGLTLQQCCESVALSVSRSGSAILLEPDSTLVKYFFFFLKSNGDRYLKLKVERKNAVFIRTWQNCVDK
jgi:hypothetical protein